MNRLRIFVLFAVVFYFTSNILAQETIKVMHYNLMYYGKNVYDCSGVSNNIDEKNTNLKKIIQYVQPDLFSVNELDGEGAYPVSDDATYLLENALNVDGVSHYRRTEFPDIYLANTIFYNINKFVLKTYAPISYYLGGNEKIFNVYQFYFNAEDLEITNDTAYLYCAVTHLKAGNDPSYELQRAYETSLIMDYFESLGIQGNYLIMGDFNVYSPSEACFQNFINPDNSNYTFYDPANQIGEWSSNYNYRNIHTQSTHTSGDCFSGGGMDDRFDFILASDYIMNGTNHYEYIQDSYKAIGQDGSSYNGSLNTTDNSVVPSSVARALYNMSDHLPVYLELKVDQNRGEPVKVYDAESEGVQVSFNNPVNEILNLQIELEHQKELRIEIFSVKGEKVFQTILTGRDKFMVQKIKTSGFLSGIYFLNITSKKEFIYSSKLIIKN